MRPWGHLEWLFSHVAGSCVCNPTGMRTSFVQPDRFGGGGARVRRLSNCCTTFSKEHFGSILYVTPLGQPSRTVPRVAGEVPFVPEKKKVFNTQREALKNWPQCPAPESEIADGDAAEPVQLVGAAVRRHDERVDDEQHALLERLVIEALVRLSRHLTAHNQPCKEHRKNITFEEKFPLGKSGMSIGTRQAELGRFALLAHAQQR